MNIRAIWHCALAVAVLIVVASVCTFVVQRALLEDNSVTRARDYLRCLQMAAMISDRVGATSSVPMPSSSEVCDALADRERVD